MVHSPAVLVHVYLCILQTTVATIIKLWTDVHPCDISSSITQLYFLDVYITVDRLLFGTIFKAEYFVLKISLRQVATLSSYPQL